MRIITKVMSESRGHIRVIWGEYVDVFEEYIRHSSTMGYFGRLLCVRKKGKRGQFPAYSSRHADECNVVP